MDRIESRQQFLDAEVYYPAWEPDWLDLYSKTVGALPPSRTLTVQIAARFILDNPDYLNKLVEKIRELCLKYLAEGHCVDACPSLYHNGKIYLRGGNKRSIAYGMKILEGEDYHPIKIQHWSENWIKEDLDNLQKRKTTDHPVVDHPDQLLDRCQE